MSDDKYNLTIKVTREQEDTIKALFAHNGWDFQKIEPVPPTDAKRKVRKRKQQNQEEEHKNCAYVAQPSSPDNLDETNEDPVNKNVCPYCFLDPCVAEANSSAPWIGPGQPPHINNPSVRKGLYKRFWYCINNIGGWTLPQYKAKKISVGGGGEGIVMHCREIMPECVLKLVRNKYPNPSGQAYMGHMWE